MGVKLALKAPSFHVDTKKLKKGIWGNTWGNWGLIMLAFLALYTVEAGYFTGLLFTAKAVRGDNYKSLPGRFFGSFDTQKIDLGFPLIPGQASYFNRPQGCVQQDDGIQACDTGKNGNQWVLFPWTLDTNNLGQFPGCSNKDGAASTLSTFISGPTSPAYIGSDEVAPPQAQEEFVCQNFAAAP